MKNMGISDADIHEHDQSNQNKLISHLGHGRRGKGRSTMARGMCEGELQPNRGKCAADNPATLNLRSDPRNSI